MEEAVAMTPMTNELSFLGKKSFGRYPKLPSYVPTVSAPAAYENIR